MTTEAFPNYTQLSSRLPEWLWWILRFLTLLLTVSVITLLFVSPQTGLLLFWKVLIPLLPLCFVFMPGLWRNICPMALLNQIPRQLKFSREFNLSGPWRKLAFYLSLIGFVMFVFMRHPVLNESASILGSILLLALLLAFVGGFFFKGRSGWCGTFCPLAPVQKAYGHAPLILVPNGYCKPCLGCQKNCYDFNPRAAFFSDLQDADVWWSDQRKFFVSLLPGLIAGFFNSEYSASSDLLIYIQSMMIPLLVSSGSFYLIHNLLQINYFRLSSLYVVLALVIFYWNGASVIISGINELFSVQLLPLIETSVQYLVLLIGIAVFIRFLFAERQYRLSEQISANASLGKGVESLKNALNQTAQMTQVIEQSSGSQLLVRPGQNLLDVIEENDMPIMSGCRMGMCGSDPVVIVDGMDNLNPPDDNELNTLRRLGLEGKARLACCCKPKGAMTFDLDSDPTRYSLPHDQLESEKLAEQENRLTVVVIGNGIGGISTAETLREKDKSCRIILISSEPHHFYNRMGLEAVVHGKTAMQGLYLLKQEWYQQNDIEFWLNTQVSAILPKQHQITLAGGESQDYDKLVLATGAKAFIPDQSGFDLEGVFVLRNAADALNIRAYVQQHECRRVVVLGGGVLGIEAADALLQLGMKVSLIHTGPYLMNRQLDMHSAVILKDFLSNKGVRVITTCGIRSIQQQDELKKVLLTNGKELVTDIVLLCIGVRSNMELAQEAGLEVGRGIRVNAQMQTSDSDIYSVGDAAELPGAIGGLWSVASAQGKVAADAILNGESQYQLESLVPVQLKVQGIDLKCFGIVECEDDQESFKHFTQGDVGHYSWRHLVLKDKKIVGGVFVNSPSSASEALRCIKKNDMEMTELEVESILARDSGSEL